MNKEAKAKIERLIDDASVVVASSAPNRRADHFEAIGHIYALMGERAKARDCRDIAVVIREAELAQLTFFRAHRPGGSAT